MPRFSVIVPTHNVQAFIRQCIESVLSQTFGDFELIVIDDSSTDETVGIAVESRDNDQRVRLIQLEGQQDGPGLVRNRAIDEATGEWIVFVDSDDWVEPTMLERLDESIGAHDPDIVLFDYDRAYWWGRRVRNARADVLGALGGQVVAGVDHPELFEVMPVAWNKAYRRAFIDRHDFRFPRGIYEDQPWTYGMFAVCDRIAVVDEVLYHYRQRRSGNLLRTESDAHFDVLEQWDRVSEFVGGLPRADVVRPIVFDRMLSHAVFVYGRGSGRLRKHDRRRFFSAMSSRYRQHLPEGHLTDAEVSPLRAWLVANDAFGRYEVFKIANRTQRRLRRSSTMIRRRATRQLDRAKTASVRRIYRHVLCRLPVRKDRAVYSAYWNRQYACNPRAIYEEALRSAPHIRGVWCVKSEGEPRVPDGTPVVEAGTLRWYHQMATAKYFVNNVNVPGDIRKRPGQIYLQTHHGTPLKSMGADLVRFPVAEKGQNIGALLRRSDRWDYCLSSNRYSTEIWARAYPCQFQVLNSGYPRNDVLVRSSPGVEDQVRRRLSIPDGKKVILYAPTLRDHQKRFEFPFDVSSLAEALGDEYVMLVRAHYLVPSGSSLEAAESSKFLIDVSAYPVVEDLYLASDLLLTDYSSVMFDFANLGRPIVIFAHDWETYLATRGVYFDLLAAPPGTVTRGEAELIDVLANKTFSTDESRVCLDAFRARFCEFDDGRAAERVVRFLFGDGTWVAPATAGGKA